MADVHGGASFYRCPGPIKHGMHDQTCGDCCTAGTSLSSPAEPTFSLPHSREKQGRGKPVWGFEDAPSYSGNASYGQPGTILTIFLGTKLSKYSECTLMGEHSSAYSTLHHPHLLPRKTAAVHQHKHCTGNTGRDNTPPYTPSRSNPEKQELLT